MQSRVPLWKDQAKPNYVFKDAYVNGQGVLGRWLSLLTSSGEEEFC